MGGVDGFVDVERVGGGRGAYRASERSEVSEANADRTRGADKDRIKGESNKRGIE